MRALVLVKVIDGAYWSVPGAVALRDRGHDVTFALPSTEGLLPDVVRAAGLPVIRAEAPLMGGGVARQPAAMRRLRRQVREHGADVVISHLYASALAGRFATTRTPTKHVFVSPGPLYLESPVIRAVERRIARLDDHVICSSGSLLHEYARLGVPPERRSLVPYSVRPDYADRVPGQDREQVRADLGLADDAFVVLCAAMFYAPKAWVHRGRGIKGHDVLFPAWERYRQRGGTGTLLVVGGGIGPAGTEYRAALLDRWAHLPGIQVFDRAFDVRAFYRAADVSVAPSLSDNLGSPSEAGSLGIPTIASSVPALAEVVVDGWNGWLVPPDDPERLATALAAAEAADPSERARRGRRAAQRSAELFDEATNTAAFADVIERVVSGG